MGDTPGPDVVGAGLAPALLLLDFGYSVQTRTLVKATSVTAV
jgi:hypothetical protein